jgi:O-antigen/teichoic acid export membrane protein
MATELKQRKLRTNFVFNVVGMGIPLVVALITIPLYIAQIGTARFGVITIVWILLGYFGFIDFGLSRASAKALATLANASRKRRVGAFMTSLYLNLFLGVVGAVILYFSGHFLLHRLLTLSDPISTELDASLPWIAGTLPVLLVAAVCHGAIESKERFLAVNSFDVATFTLGQILPLLAAIMIAPTLPVVIAAAFVARLASMLVMLCFVFVKEKVYSLRVFDKKIVGELARFSAWAGITNIIGTSLLFLDQLLVGFALGASAIAHYAVPMNVVTRSQIVAKALARATFPRFSRMSREHAIDLGERSAVSLGFVYGAICASVIVLSRILMTLWIGPQFALEAAPILEVLLIGAWINGIAFVPYGLLQGQGRPDLVAKVHAMEILPYAIALWFLLSKFGVLGAAIAWTLRVAIDTAFLLKVAKFRARNMIGLALALLLMLGSYAVTIKLGDIAPLWSLALAGTVFLMFVASAMILDANLKRVALGWRSW